MEWNRFKKGCYVGQENTARIKLKNKLNKKLFAIKIIEGNINSNEIFLKDKEIGKLLIKNKNPFAIIKTQNNLLDFENIYQCGSAKIKILKPDWL
jgi:folate-binding protein YgfZ